MRVELDPIPILIVCLSCLFACGCSDASKANNLEDAISLLHAARSHYNGFSQNSGRDEAVDKVLEMLGSLAFVEEAGSDDDAIWFEIRDGGTAYLYTEEQEGMLAAGDTATILEASSPNLVGLGDLEQVLEQHDIDTLMIPSESVTLDMIAGIQSDDTVLYFFGHGGYVSLQYYDHDGERVDPGLGPCLQLGQQIHTADDLPSRWHSAWNRKLVVAKLDTASNDPVHLCIKPQFIREHVRLYNDPLVFVSSCYSGINPSLWEAFRDAGAGAFLGWSNQVCWYSVRDTHTHFFGYMLDECMTVDQARGMKPIASYGYCGPDTGLYCHCDDPAYLQAFGDVAKRFCTETTCEPECAEGDTGCTDDLRQRWYCGDAGDGDTCLDKVYVPCASDEECRDAACTGMCQSVCNLGDVQCYSSTAYQECVLAGDCRQWGEPVSCPAGQTCYDGACTTGCQSDPGCSGEGTTRCYSGTQFQECSEVVPGCFKWESPVDCPDPQVCVDQGNCTCDSPCNNGQRRCSGAASYQECEPAGVCWDWSDPIECPSGETCSGAGACEAGCTSDPGCASATTRRCTSPTSFQQCVEVEPGCFKWSSEQSCPAGQTCSNGVCSASCSDECAADGERECVTTLDYRLCGDSDADDCLDWGPQQACADDQQCNDVTTSPNHCLCDDQCDTPFAIRCITQTTYQICGDSNNNGCMDWGADPGGPGATVTCPAGEVCVGPDAANACAADCTPDCDGKECGDDGCGGTCGSCPSPQTCGPGQMCQPPEAVELATGQLRAQAIALDATRVYWVKTALYDGEINSVPLGGGSLTNLASGQADPRGIAIGGSHVYWTSDALGGAIHRVLRTGGAAETIVSGETCSEMIATEATSVYWASSCGGDLRKAGAAGESPASLASGYNYVLDLTVRDGVVYFTGWKDGTSRVEGVNAAGGPVTTLATGESPYGIACDGEYVYWSDQPAGTINRVSIYGSNATTIATGQHSPRQLAVDDACVYWTTDGSTSGKVWKAPKSGGEPVLLADDQSIDSSADIAVDDTSVYWTTSVRVMKTSK